jgi:hypothetical protein
LENQAKPATPPIPNKERFHFELGRFCAGCLLGTVLHKGCPALEGKLKDTLLDQTTAASAGINTPAIINRS